MEEKATEVAAKLATKNFIYYYFVGRVMKNQNVHISQKNRIRSFSVDRDDLRRILEILQERAHAAAELEEKHLIRLDGQTDEEYEQTKKERKARQSQRVGLLKEIRVRPRVQEHDLETKIRVARRLLEEGDKVKVFINGAWIGIAKNIRPNLRGVSSAFLSTIINTKLIPTTT